MPEDKETENRKKLYLFIRDRSVKTNLQNIRLYADSIKMKRPEMGFALSQLRDNGTVTFSKRYGWMAR